MRSAHHGSVLSALALGAVAAAYAGDSTSEQPFDAASDGPSCPLPVGKQVQAVAAFKAMMPVFRHARCSNCHGSFDITSDEHQGSDFAINTGLDPRSLLTAAERQRLHDACGTCHSNIRGSMTRLDGTQLAGWLVAPAPMLWNGKSDEQLCLDMKRFEPTGAQFLDHVEHDHDEIQFVEAAFQGDRALGEEGLREYGVTVEKPPGTLADLVAKARKWVDLLGDGYQASPECGCVLPKIKLGIHHTMASEVPQGFPSNIASEVRFELELAPMGDDKPGMFMGERTLTRNIQLTVPADCQGSGTQRERWVLYAYVDSTSGEVNTWRQLVQQDPQGKITCREQPGQSELGLGPVISGLAFGGLKIPPDSGSSKTVTEEDGGERESLTITVLEVPSER